MPVTTTSGGKPRRVLTRGPRRNVKAETSPEGRRARKLLVAITRTLTIWKIFSQGTNRELTYAHANGGLF